MTKNFTMKRLTLALALTGALMTTTSIGWAAVTPMTESIQGIKPALKVSAKGTLAVGQTISVDSANAEIWQFLDRDGDADKSLSTLQWYRVPAGATDMTGAVALGNAGDSSIVLTVADVGHQLGFTVIPLTETGVPDRNSMLTVLDITKWGGIDENGTDTGGKTNPEVTDPGGNGQITDPQELNAVIYTDAAGTIPLVGHPQVNTSYYVRIYSDTAKTQDVTTDYQDTIKWHLVDPTTNVDTVVAAANTENTEFKTQLNNAAAQAQHSTHLSEQGMQIYVEFGN